MGSDVMSDRTRRLGDLPLAVRAGFGGAALPQLIGGFAMAPGRLARAVWIYFEVVSQIEALPDLDFRDMPIGRRDASLVAWEDAMRSLKSGRESWAWAGIGWTILILAAGALAILG